jgi:hypothetical protein
MPARAGICRAADRERDAVSCPWHRAARSGKRSFPCQTAYGGRMKELIREIRKYRKRIRLIRSLIRNRKKIPAAAESLLKIGKALRR